MYDLRKQRLDQAAADYADENYRSPADQIAEALSEIHEPAPEPPATREQFLAASAEIMATKVVLSHLISLQLTRSAVEGQAATEARQELLAECIAAATFLSIMPSEAGDQLRGLVVDSIKSLFDSLSGIAGVIDAYIESRAAKATGNGRLS